MSGMLVSPNDSKRKDHIQKGIGAHRLVLLRDSFLQLLLAVPHGLLDKTARAASKNENLQPTIRKRERVLAI